MGIFDFLKRPMKQSALTSVSGEYQTRTASRRQAGVVATNEQARESAREFGFLFVDYVIDGIRLAGIDRKQNGYVYEVYNADSRAQAVQFLRRIPIHEIPYLHYVIVETPEGNVGRDLNGMFDE